MPGRRRGKILHRFCFCAGAEIYICVSVCREHSAYNRIMSNGLFSNYEYYFTRLPCQWPDDVRIYHKGYTVACISRNNGYVNESYHVTDEEFQTLRPGVWIGGQVIDVVGTLLEREWVEWVFMSTNFTYLFFGDRGANRDFYNTKLPRSGKILMPYLQNKEHYWLLFIVDLDNHEISLRDSRNTTEDDMQAEILRVKNHFYNFINICRA
ncbi:hypothetical protein QAD02_020983 [Eretmocerus hayati]|uniref:Uncharacterized protein n=1 Tax=Eretmocerus hayati TaxID=131215 RepID=A0ACC2PP58_9HYME|nr:hypothetical protein QAD02_020983 [Eretmocerus hayati]